MSRDSLVPDFNAFDPNNIPTVTKPSSRLDIAGAAFNLSFKQAETSSLVRTLKNEAANSDKDVEDHQALNKEYRLPVPLNKPMSRAKFDRLVKEDIERKKLQDIIANGANDNVDAIVSFGSSLAAQAVDPIGIASGVVTGSLAAKVMAKAGLAARAGGIGTRVVDGVVGNLVAEAAFVIPNAKQEQQDIDTYDNLVNAIYGGVTFPIALKGLGLGFKATAKMFNLIEMRINAGQKPFGSIAEMESVTRADLDKLIDRKTELSAKLESASEDEGFAIRQELDALEDSITKLDKEASDEKGLREQANSRDQDLYYDKEAQREVEEFTKNPQVASTKEVVDQTFTRELEDTDLAEEKAIILKDKQNYEQGRLKVEEASDIIAACLGERFLA